MRIDPDIQRTAHMVWQEANTTSGIFTGDGRSGDYIPRMERALQAERDRPRTATVYLSIATNRHGEHAHVSGSREEAYAKQAKTLRWLIGYCHPEHMVGFNVAAASDAELILRYYGVGCPDEDSFEVSAYEVLAEKTTPLLAVSTPAPAAPLEPPCGGLTGEAALVAAGVPVHHTNAPKPAPRPAGSLWNDPRVEPLARAMTVAMGQDPDAVRPATGYLNAPLVPEWDLQKEWAVRHLAALDHAERERRT